MVNDTLLLFFVRVDPNVVIGIVGMQSFDEGRRSWGKKILGGDEACLGGIHQKQLYTCCKGDLLVISAIASCFQLPATRRHNGVRDDTCLIVVNVEGKRIFEYLYVKITHEYVFVQVKNI